MTNEEVAVSCHNYDIIFKSRTETFADRTLKMFGINTVPIVWAEKTELHRKQLFAADSLEKARTIIEDAMKAQARKRPQ